MQPIKPGILLPDGTTIYPTGNEWLLAFALNGCQWAIDALIERERKIEEQWLQSMRNCHE